MLSSYPICPYRGWTQIEARAQLEARGQSSNSEIEAGSEFTMQRALSWPSQADEGLVLVSIYSRSDFNIRM